MHGSINIIVMLGNNCLALTDSLGLKFLISPSSGDGRISLQEAKDCFQQARQYLADTPLGKLLKQMDEDSDEIYKVVVSKNSKETSAYDPFTRTIFWDCNMGVVTNYRYCGDIKGSLSPAVVLGHEVAHQEDHRKDTKRHNDRKKKKDPDYSNEEERRVIEELEVPTARHLGETTRSGHHGEPSYVNGPTTRPQIPRSPFFHYPKY